MLIPQRRVAVIEALFIQIAKDGPVDISRHPCRCCQEAVPIPNHERRPCRRVQAPVSLSSRRCAHSISPTHDADVQAPSLSYILNMLRHLCHSRSSYIFNTPPHLTISGSSCTSPHWRFRFIIDLKLYTPPSCCDSCGTSCIFNTPPPPSFGNSRFIINLNLKHTA